MYYAVAGFSKEIDHYNQTGDYWGSVKYGLIGTGEAAAATALWGSPSKFGWRGAKYANRS